MEAKLAPNPPRLEGKLEYLCYVGDCVSREQQWKQGFQMVKPILDPQPHKARKKRKVRIKKLNNNPLLVEVGKPVTKTERMIFPLTPHSWAHNLMRWLQ